MNFSPSSSSKKARLESPGVSHSSNDDTEPIVVDPTIVTGEDDDPIAEVQVKAEPLNNVKESLLAKTLSKPVKHDRVVENDFAVGFGTVAYNDYQEDPSVYGDDMGHYGGSGGLGAFSFAADEHEQARDRRQLILQFITANKGRLSDAYVCLICNKQVTDNSNMNKHLEFKHGPELKSFLESLAL